MSQSVPSSVTPSAVLPRQSEPAGFTIREITSAADKLRFIKFPWEIYKGDPYWVPPFISERVDFLNPKKNPSFEHMEVALFLAEKPGSSGLPRIRAFRPGRGPLPCARTMGSSWDSGSPPVR